jgi:hypothetical protein
MAGLARDDDGRTAPARANGAIAVIVFVGVSCISWPIRMVGRFAESGAIPTGDPGGDHRQPAAVVVADGVAGDGVGDARLLRALRPRSHPFVARAARRVFAVRIGTMALSIVLMGALLAGPFINVLAGLGRAALARAYGVVAALGLAATAAAIALTIALFKTIGPKRTRFIAQIVAAVIGAPS